MSLKEAVHEEAGHWFHAGGNSYHIRAVGRHGGGIACSERDTACKEFAKLAEGEQFDKIIEKVDSKRTILRRPRSTSARHTS